MRLTTIFAGLAFAAVSASVAAQDAPRYPSRPIRIVVPYAPGGFTDIVSRLVAQKVGTTLGQPVIVENKAGASTMLGAEAVARSPADGYTLLMAVTTTLSTNPLLFKKLPYKATDFTPVALTGLTPFVLMAHPSVPAKNVKDLVAIEKAKPGSLNIATLGTGSSTHLVAEMFHSVTGTKLQDVPYKGAALALNDLMAGHVQLYFDAISTSLPYMKSGQLKPIALTAEQRSPVAPQVPTFAELGYPGMVAYSWYGLLAPTGTPSAIVITLNKAVNDALQSPDVRARLAAEGATAPTMNPAQFGQLIEAHTKTWAKVIAPLNIQLD